MNILKTLQLVLLLLICSGPVIAQCKFEKDKKDSFSGEQYRLSATKIGQKTYNWKIKLEQNGEKYRVGMLIKWGMHVANGIEKDSDFLFLKLANGELITIQADNFYAVGHGGVPGTGQIVSVFEPFGLVDVETIRKLSQSTIVALKCSYGGVEQELPKIKSGEAEDVMEYAKCLLK